MTGLEFPVAEEDARHELRIYAMVTAPGFGIIMKEEEIVKKLGEDNVVHVKPIFDQKECPSPNYSWCYDRPSKRKGVLSPFNQCDVVRVRIHREKTLGMPIKRFSPYTVIGMLVKHGECEAVRALLQKKGMNRTTVFPLLPP